MKLKHFFLAISCQLLALSSFAQQVSINATIDSSSILIGNRAHIKVEVTYEAKNGPVKVQWPIIGDSLVSKVPVVKKSKIDTVIPDSTHPTMMRQVQNYTITCFDSGYYAIPPFDFVINGDTNHKQSSEALMLQVRTIPIDTSKGFKDIKAPIQVGFSWLEVLPYIGWGLLALLVLGTIIFFLVRYFKNKKTEPVVIKEPPVPIDVKALKALAELAEKKLWQEGKIKEYQSGITDILREYIDARFKINAIEMTSDEILYALNNRDLSEAQKRSLRQIMILSDLVKFAKESPLPTDHELSLNLSIDFVKDTTQPQNNPA